MRLEGKQKETVVIDWITARVPCLHPTPIDGGRVIKVDPDGDVEWATPQRRSIAGSYDSSLYVRTVGVDSSRQGVELEIHGNPAKWFQGHNVFGTGDLVGLVAETMYELTRLLDLTPTDVDRAYWAAGNFKLSRVDVTESFALGSTPDVRAWLRAAEFCAKTRHGRGSMKGGTLYWGKHSRRWALKCYCKHDELQAPGHQLPTPLRDTGIPLWAADKLRIELVFRSLELKKLGLGTGAGWLEMDSQVLHSQYLQRLEISGQMRLTPEQLSELPARLVAVYQLWADGHDLRAMYPKATFYRYRSELQKHGIDIAITQGNRADMSNVVPLVRILEAVPSSIPHWAEGTPLFFEPRARVS